MLCRFFCRILAVLCHPTRKKTHSCLVTLLTLLVKATNLQPPPSTSPFNILPLPLLSTSSLILSFQPPPSTSAFNFLPQPLLSTFSLNLSFQPPPSTSAFNILIHPLLSTSSLNRCLQPSPSNFCLQSAPSTSASPGLPQPPPYTLCFCARLCI